ncbi:conserved hypothetical protein [Neospora caninum Liverpool]|uniref:Polycystin cation channel PKD1/PKD2 domain-containing protein n=1 Tax=Neospora caninum (strain Liverpool) TaxID=572307 RepID=F0VQG5_NEOCL|nr:conserved hypothetical protein [Neospora caninum Liverpool]CBZ55962.1 conserved hypothetical protein [Neospora caninum Liverpool]|eukprot:XP_003885988.1 conserved hypothetical protein [Neospora caninum Liverpool]
MRPMPPVLAAKAVNKLKPIPPSQPYHVPLRELPYVPVEAPAPAPAAPEPVQVRVEAAPAPQEIELQEAVSLPVVREKKVREKKARAKEELQDPAKLDVGEVIRNQKSLSRREVYRRRLFPVSFEYAAGQVSEGDIILGRRPNIVEALAYVLFLVAFILFVAANAEVPLVHSTNSSLQEILAATQVPSGSAFNTWSSLAAETDAAVAELTVKGSEALFLSLQSLRTKADVASWLRHGLFGLPSFPNIGKNVICGPCVRLTVRRLNFTETTSAIGYTEVWPVDSVSATGSLSTSSMQLTGISERLGGTTADAGARLQWTYTAYPVQSTKTFQGQGGYAETICGANADAMLQKLSQNQPLSRYPPWFLPNGLIGSRHTVTVVADFLSVNPESFSTSYTYIPFQFTSAGTLLPVRVWSQTALSSAGRSSAGLRYGCLAASVVFLLAYLWFLYLKVREVHGFRPFIYDFWNCFAVAHLALVLLTFLFFLLASLVSSVPGASSQVGQDGVAIAQSEWLTADLSETLNEKASAVATVATMSQLFWTVAAIAVFCGCILMIRYLQVWGGAAAKTMDWTLKRLLLPLLMCMCFMLVVLLVFVAIGNIAFGVDNRAFAGFYESLTSSAAFLLGGTVGNFDVYDIVANHRFFAGLYFGPLFILFSFLCFNILVALVLKTYDSCAEEVETSVKKQTKKESEFQPTRLDRWVHALSGFRKQLQSSIASMKSKEKIVDLASECSDEEKVTDSGDEPPQYPAWMWQSMGLPNPYTKEGWIDPHAWSEYQQMYGAWGDCSFQQAGAAMQGAGWMNADEYYYMQSAAAKNAQMPELDKIHRVVHYQQTVDRETSWHKLACVAFLAVLVVVVSSQLMVSSALDLRKSVDAALGRTTWIPLPQSYIFDDQSLGGASRPFLVNSWATLPLPYSVRLRVNLSTASNYPLELQFVAADAVSFDLFLDSSWSDATLLSVLKGLQTNRLIRSVCASLEIAFVFYSNFDSRNQLSLTTLRFEIASGGTVKTTLDVPSMVLRPYDAQHGGLPIILQSFVALMVFLCVCAGLYSLFKFFRDNPFQHMGVRSLCYRFFLFFFDNLFNLLDLVLLVLFIVAILCWTSFAFHGVQHIYFSTSGTGFATSASASSDASPADSSVAARALSAASGVSQQELYTELNAFYSSLSAAHSLLEVYAQLCGGLVILAFLRTLRLFEKRKRMVVLFFTVTEASQHLLFMFFTLVAVYVGVVFTCYLSFGTVVAGFASVRASFVSGLLLLVGCMPLSDLFAANKAVAGLFLFPSLFLVNLVFLALFLSVLLRSFAFRLGEVESAEALLGAPPRTLGQSVKVFFKELVCKFERPPPPSAPPPPPAPSPPAPAAAFPGLRGDDEESLDEFAAIREFDEQARAMRRRPLKVADVPKETMTTQLTDAQWARLAPKVRDWAVVEAGEFADLFRRLCVQSELAGAQKIAFVQQTEKKYFEQISALAKEVQQQEAHLSHRLAVYKNNLFIEQQKLATYTTYLEQALEERKSEAEMLRREFELVKAQTEDPAEPHGRARKNR